MSKATPLNTYTSRYFNHKGEDFVAYMTFEAKSRDAESNDQYNKVGYVVGEDEYLVVRENDITKADRSESFYGLVLYSCYQHIKEWLDEEKVPYTVRVEDRKEQWDKGCHAVAMSDLVGYMECGEHPDYSNDPDDPDMFPITDTDDWKKVVGGIVSADDLYTTLKTIDDMKFTAKELNEIREAMVIAHRYAYIAKNALQSLGVATRDVQALFNHEKVTDDEFDELTSDIISWMDDAREREGYSRLQVKVTY